MKISNRSKLAAVVLPVRPVRRRLWQRQRRRDDRPTVATPTTTAAARRLRHAPMAGDTAAEPTGRRLRRRPRRRRRQLRRHGPGPGRHRRQQQPGPQDPGGRGHRGRPGRHPQRPRPVHRLRPDRPAFAKIPAADLDDVLADKDTLTEILTYHVVPERIEPADLGGTYTTVERRRAHRLRRRPVLRRRRRPGHGRLLRRPDRQRHRLPHRLGPDAPGSLTPTHPRIPVRGEARIGPGLQGAGPGASGPSGRVPARRCGRARTASDMGRCRPWRPSTTTCWWWARASAGSVTALRLTEKGYRVGVLEAGRRFDTDDAAQDQLAAPQVPVGAPARACAASSGSPRSRTSPCCRAPASAAARWSTPTRSTSRSTPFYTDPPVGPHHRLAGRAGARSTTRPSACSASTRSPTTRRPTSYMHELADRMGVADTYHRTPVGVWFGKPGERVPDPYFGGEGPDKVGCTALRRAAWWAAGSAPRTPSTATTCTWPRRTAPWSTPTPR